jgi:hypothetical protein
MITIYSEALAAANDKSRRLRRLVRRSVVCSGRDFYTARYQRSSYDKCIWRRLDADHVFYDMSQTREGGAT